MNIRDRQARLVEIVWKEEKATVEMLAERLGASRETIRRDLTRLAQQGKIQKVHGGAVKPTALGEPEFQQRLSENAPAKMAIAKTAAALFRPGEALFIDTGSTTLFFAEEIARRGGLTIITNSTEIARVIDKAGNGHRVFLLGGEYRAGNSQTVGTMVAEQIRAFRAHHAVLTVGALDRRTGAMDYNIEEAQVARAMIAQSEKLTILADHSKFGALASFEVCPLARIDNLVCDGPVPQDIREALEAGGAACHRAVLS